MSRPGNPGPSGPGGCQDLLEALTAPCATCDSTREIAWCPSWDAYLCAHCRIVRADAEFRPAALAARPVPIWGSL